MATDRPDRLPASLTLIGPDDPAPFVLLNEHGTAPAVVVCDHASRAFPRSMGRLGLAEVDAWRHIAWDIGAGELARGLSAALDAPAVLAGYSRLVVDCNRAPADPEAFRTASDGTAVPGNVGLGDEEKRTRLGTFHDPYHGAIEALLGGLRARGVTPLLVSVHSYTPVMDGVARPWHAGVLYDRDEASARAVLEGLRAVEGLVVGDNEPYSGRHPGDYTVDHHAESAGLPSVCIEVRQDLLESPAGVERWVRLLARVIGARVDAQRAGRGTA
ncbi:MAG: N-formylglutamate amidohydrolase [Steroidobacteraceae bacterium]